MSETTIQTASEQDKEAIATVLSKAGLADNTRRGKQVYLDELDRGDTYYLATVDETPAGLVSWRQQGEIRHGLAELYHIAVRPRYQGTNVATNLFKHLEQQLHTYYNKHDGTLRKLYLLTHEDNERAQAFYEKIGLTHEATLNDHFHDDLDEYVYSKHY